MFVQIEEKASEKKISHSWTSNKKIIGGKKVQ